MRVWLALAGVAALAGCDPAAGGLGMPGSPAWFMTATPEQEAAYFGQVCASYGFAAGTPEMAQCVAQESRTARGAASARMDAMATPRPMMPQSATPDRMVCTPLGAQVVCQSR